MSNSPNQPERTRFLARILGPFTVIFSIAVLLHVDAVGQLLTDFFANGFNVWLTGILLLVGGLTIIALHPYWRGLAAILVSLFGWSLALRGSAILIIPGVVSTVADAVLPNPALILTGFAFLFIIGAYLSYAGWIAKKA